jgi:hypothetical protein
MSAGFDIAGEVFWGTNGAIECYVEALAEQAVTRFGPDERLAIFFREERECFFMGKVVFLDDVLIDAETRRRFLEVLDAATEQLLRREVFTASGKAWVESTISQLRERVAGIGKEQS